jgi:hypothetical protein
MNQGNDIPAANHNHDIPAVHPQAASRVIDGEAVIVLADSGDVLMLNASGSILWELIDGVRTSGEIARVLGETCGFQSEQAQVSTAAILQELAGAGAVVLGRSAA